MASEHDQFFFVCGHSRSGTTWLERLLDLHPQINCTGECHFEVLRQAFDTFTTRPWHLASGPPMKDEAEACFADTVRRCMASLADRKPGASWIGDRTPRPLRSFLPGSPHILLVRDPRDVAVSYTIHQLNTNGLDIQREPFKSSMQGKREQLLGNPAYFDEHPEAMFDDERWVRHIAHRWARRMDKDLAALERFRIGEIAGRAMMVRFEELRTDTEAMRAELYQFLEVDPAKAEPLSEATRTLPGVRGASPSGKDRKGDIGQWKAFAQGEPGAMFRRVFKEELGPLLIRLEYEQDMGW